MERLNFARNRVLVARINADEFHAQRLRVGQAKLLDQIAQGAVGFAGEPTGADLAIQISHGHPKVR